MLCHLNTINAQFKAGQSLVNGGFRVGLDGVKINPITNGRTEELRYYYAVNAGIGKFLNKHTALMLGTAFNRSRYQAIRYTIVTDTLSNGAIVKKEEQEEYLSYSRGLDFSIGVRRYFAIEKKFLVLVSGQLNWNNQRSRTIDDGYESLGYNRNTFSINIDPGVTYLLNKRWSLEAFIDGFYFNYEPKTEDYRGQLVAGFNGKGALNLGLVYFPK